LDASNKTRRTRGASSSTSRRPAMRTTPCRRLRAVRRLGHSSQTASKRDERNGTQRDGQGRISLSIRSDMGRTEPTGSARNIAGSAHTSGVYGLGSDTQSRKNSARGSRGCPIICPSDRRHMATGGGMVRHVIGGRVASDGISRYHPTCRIGSPKPQLAGSIPAPPAPRKI